jgi:hypothetical protein
MILIMDPPPPFRGGGRSVHLFNNIAIQSEDEREREKEESW